MRRVYEEVPEEEHAERPHLGQTLQRREIRMLGLREIVLLQTVVQQAHERPQNSHFRLLVFRVRLQFSAEVHVDPAHQEGPPKRQQFQRAVRVLRPAVCQEQFVQPLCTLPSNRDCQRKVAL